MLLPFLLIALAVLAAAVVAYGTHPGWGGFEHGLQLIVWSRRLEWPLVALAIVCCLTLIALVILGRRRAWWLIGLGPILALFLHHFAPFAPDRAGALAVIENPAMLDVGASPAGGVAEPADDDWVVGLELGDGSYAYPYSALFHAPVVFQSEHRDRMVLLWSAYANRALAFRVTGPLRARDLEVVSEPADALLVYDTRRGQFINGLKGLTTEGGVPACFGAPLLTTKTTWRQWRAANPSGKVMAASPGAVTAPGGQALPAPTRPLLPAYAVPGHGGPARTADPRPRVTVVGWPRPVAFDTTLLGPDPIDITIDGTAGLLVQPSPASPPRAFALPAVKPPATNGSVATRFVPAKGSPRHPGVAFRETASDTLWTADGAGIPRTKSAGARLKPLPVDDNVDQAVMEYWYPGLKIRDGR